MQSTRIRATFALLSICAPTLFAQAVAPKTETPAPKAADPTKAAKPETPPDQAALAVARKIEDPARKLAALNDVLAKYPKSKIEEGVRLEIFRATLKAHPNDKRLVMSAAKAVLKAVPKEYQRNVQDDVATALLRANVYLPEADKYARKALASYKQKAFYAERSEQAAKAKRDPPSDAELLMSYKRSRGHPLQTVGELAIKAGRVAEGRRMLAEVVSDHPMALGANIALADLAVAEGDESKALDHLLVAKLAGGLSDKVLADLKRLYAKQHGSTDTLDATLDQIYDARFPSPLHVKRYESAPGRPARVVLAEFFTGAGCPPCASADLAFDAILERYSRDEVALVVYHQHIPAPDPMAFPAARKRFEFYQRGGVPTYVIDGDKDGGGGPREAARNTYERIDKKIAKRLSEPATATITLQAARDGGKVVVKAAVDPITGDKRDLRLHVVLVEESLRYSGENGVRYHPMVVRGIAGPDTAEGVQLELGKKYAGEPSFDIPAIVASLKAHLDDYEVNGNHGKIQFSQKMHEIDANRLAVVAFVQDAGSRAVLQSQFTRVRAQTASTR